MRFVSAIIKPFKLDDVRKSLSEIGVLGATVTDVRGLGRQQGQTQLYRGSEYEVDVSHKVKLEVAISDDLLESTLNSISEAASTDEIGSGKIFVTDLKQVIRIRTGETNEEAV